MADEKDPTQPIYDPEGPDDIDRRLEALAKDFYEFRNAFGTGAFDIYKTEAIDQTDATRTSIIKTHRSGETVEMEWDSIHSVEITNSVKEGWRVSKVKVYHVDPLAVARLGADLAMEAESALVRAMNAKHAAITERADAAESEESDG